MYVYIKPIFVFPCALLGTVIVNSLTSKEGSLREMSTSRRQFRQNIMNTNLQVQGKIFFEGVPKVEIFLSSSGSGTGSTQPREPREVN